MLSAEFAAAVQYSEEEAPALADFVVCFWGMQSHTDREKSIQNIITTDGCVDLVADFNNRQIGFAGMSKTNFEFSIQTPCRFFGVRMKPGAFYALTGVSASEAMDSFIPLGSHDSGFNEAAFFALSIEQAQATMKEYVTKLCFGKKPNAFTALFDELWDAIPDTAAALYERLHLSPKQTQRLFTLHFGLTPKLVLSILRFQKCLQLLTGGKASPGDMLHLVHYYDQAHFINDFKRHIGLTPFELVRRYEG
jgi:AraC-like DNA-binding protein